MNHYRHTAQRPERIMLMRHARTYQNVEEVRLAPLPWLVKPLAEIPLIGPRLAWLLVNLLDCVLRGKFTRLPYADPDVPALPAELQRARDTGYVLAQTGNMPDVILCSTHLRSRQTAEAIFSGFQDYVSDYTKMPYKKAHVPIVALEFLVEKSEGVWDGIPTDYMGIKDPLAAEVFRVQRRAYFKPDQGESLMDARERVEKSLADELAKYARKKVLIVGHLNINLAIDSVLRQTDLAREIDDKIAPHMANLAFTFYKFDPESKRWLTDPFYNQKILTP
jgi:broad specificity phosphatase PhoE